MLPLNINSSKTKLFLASEVNDIYCDSCQSLINNTVLFKTEYDSDIDYNHLCFDCVRGDKKLYYKLKDLVDKLEEFPYKNIFNNFYILDSSVPDLKYCTVNKKHNGSCEDLYLTVGGFSVCMKFLSSDKNLRDVRKKYIDSLRVCDCCECLSLDEDDLYYHFGNPEDEVSNSEVCEKCYNIIEEGISEFDPEDYKEDLVMLGLM